MSTDPLLVSLTQLGEAVYLALPGQAPQWIAPPEGLVANLLQTPEGQDAISNPDQMDRQQWLLDAANKPGSERILRFDHNGASHSLRERIVRHSAVDGSEKLIGFISDVSATKAQEERLTYLACFDALTGHYSRGHLRAQLAMSIVKAFDRNRDFCFAFIGLDEMSTINNALGYDVADEVLRGVGDCIASGVGDAGILGRVASSKFGVILPDLSAEEATELLQNVQKDIRENLIETGLTSVPATVSIGLVEVPANARTTDEAFGAAEDALTNAKVLGPSGWSTHRPDLRSHHERKSNHAMAENITTALAENRIKIALQPIVSNNGNVAFYECLARMMDRKGNLIPAMDFMPVAEKLGFVRLIDRRVMELAFDTLDSNRNLRLSINVSPQTLFDQSWRDAFARRAVSAPSSADRLIVEITESAAIHDPERVKEIVRTIADHGCAIAVDDFGAGYTSFSHFKLMPFDIVKIDGQFVRGICDSPENQVFVGSLAQLARHFDMLVVAEMVEDDEAAKLLQQLGVDCHQGFHFGRPELLEPDTMQELICEAVSA